MADTAREPVDHHPLPQPLAGETTKAARTSGRVLFILAMTAFVACVGSFAMRQVQVGVGAAIVALLAAGAALAWLAMEGRRVRQAQRDRSVNHHGGA